MSDDSLTVELNMELRKVLARIQHERESNQLRGTAFLKRETILAPTELVIRKALRCGNELKIGFLAGVFVIQELAKLS
jgi:hypothetical protein